MKNKIAKKTETIKSLLTGSAFSQPAGNSPLMRDFNTAASSLYLRSYSANWAFHSASRAAPSGTWRLQCLRNKSKPIHQAIIHKLNPRSEARKFMSFVNALTS